MLLPAVSPLPSALSKRKRRRILPMSYTTAIRCLSLLHLQRHSPRTPSAALDDPSRRGGSPRRSPDSSNLLVKRKSHGLLVAIDYVIIGLHTHF